MLSITKETLIDFLKKNGFKSEIQKETGQVVSILKIANHEFPLFLRPFQGSELLQLLVFIPIPIKSRAKSDLARLLHQINKELDIPGFGMDEDSDTCFYRVMLPTIDNKIDERVLESYLKSLTLICEQIAPTVIAVASEVATFEEILRKAKNAG